MAKPWHDVRAGQRVDVYNEGLVVYLFDRSHEQPLGSRLHNGIPAAGIADKTLRGLLVAFELDQDDGIHACIIVGSALTKKELSAARWLPVQKSFLRLPTGQLLVHSANTLACSNPTHPPACVEVSPGDYRVALHRLDWSEMRNDGILGEDGEDDWEGPEFLIVLQPLEAGVVNRLPWLLPYPATGDAAWKGKYTCDGATFQGLACFDYWWEGPWINVDRAAEQKLALKTGSLLRVEVDGLCLDAIYVGDQLVPPISTEPSTLYKLKRWAAGIAGTRPEFCAAYRFAGPGAAEANEHKIKFDRVVSKQPFRIHDRWIPAKLTVLEVRIDMPAC